jgi:hypothetical protein
VIEGDLMDVLIGKPEIETLGLTDVQQELEEKAEVMLGKKESGSEDKERSETQKIMRMRKVMGGDDVMGVKGMRQQINESHNTIPYDEEGEDESGMERVTDEEQDENELKRQMEDLIERARESGASEWYVGEMEKLVEEFKDVWRLNLGNDGHAKVKPMKIELVENAEIRQWRGMRKYSETQRQFMHEEVEMLIRMGVVERVTGAHAITSPVVVTKKSDGSYRLCVDLREVNRNTKDYPWPMPDINQLTQHLQGSKVFANFDLLKGYWQFPLDSESRRLWTFATHEGLFQPMRVQMGGKNSARYFQETLMEMFRDQLYRQVLIYLDDLLAHAESEEELVKIVRKIFEVIKMRPKKCELFKREVKWCGEIMSKDGRRVDGERVKALSEMAQPNTAAELQQLLMGANWMRDMIPQFAEIVKPLRDRLNECLSGTKRNKSAAAGVRLTGEKWGESEMKAWEESKKAIVNAVMLAHMRSDYEMCLYTDASDECWGAILTQVRTEDLERDVEEQRHEPLGFLSGEFKGSQLNWSVCDKEAFPIYNVTRKWEHLLFREKGFRIFTDHKNLKYIFDPKSRSTAVTKSTAERLERWAMALRAFDYVIEHVRGEWNTWADMLSRWGAVRETTRGEMKVRVFMKEMDDVEVIRDDWPSVEEIGVGQKRNGRDWNGLQLKDGLWWCDGEGRIWLQFERTSVYHSTRGDRGT